MIEKMLEGITVKLNVDYLSKRDEYNSMGATIIYTGSIDEYFDYSLGELEYKSLKFDARIESC